MIITPNNTICDYKNDLSSRVRKGIGTITDTLTYRSRRKCQR